MISRLLVLRLQKIVLVPYISIENIITIIGVPSLAAFPHNM